MMGGVRLWKVEVVGAKEVAIMAIQYTGKIEALRQLYKGLRFSRKELSFSGVDKVCLPTNIEGEFVEVHISKGDWLVEEGRKGVYGARLFVMKEADFKKWYSEV